MTILIGAPSRWHQGRGPSHGDSDVFLDELTLRADAGWIPRRRFEGGYAAFSGEHGAEMVTAPARSGEIDG